MDLNAFVTSMTALVQCIYVVGVTVATGLPRRIAVFTDKGGVGKTTTTTHLAAVMAAAGARVLVVDMDASCGMTGMLAPIFESEDDYRTICDLIASRNPLTARGTCFPTAWSDLEPITAGGGVIDIIPGDPQFQDDFAVPYGVDALTVTLGGLVNAYDVVLFDCPPRPGFGVQSALLASDGVVVVVNPEPGPIKKMLETLEFLNERNQANEKNVTLLGVLVTKIDVRLKIQRELIEQMKTHLGDDLLAYRIPYRASVLYDSGHNIPTLVDSDKGAKLVSEAYRASATEILRRLNDPALDKLVNSLSGGGE